VPITTATLPSNKKLRIPGGAFCYIYQFIYCIPKSLPLQKTPGYLKSMVGYPELTSSASISPSLASVISLRIYYKIILTFLNNTNIRSDKISPHDQTRDQICNYRDRSKYRAVRNTYLLCSLGIYADCICDIE